MVHQDFNPQIKTAKSKFSIAPMGDRLLAFVFDAVIFSPVFSFILANLFKKLELIYFISPGSAEFFILFGVCFLFTALLIVMFQTFFLLLMGATPGKYFFKIRVVSLHGKLRFSQALLRSFLWVIEAICLLLPFLEVLSEAYRRPLHDRAAGTMTVTLKDAGDPGPHPFETQFVRQFLVMASFCAVFLIVYLVGHFYHLAVRGEFKRAELEEQDFLCAAVSNRIDTKEARMDKALSLYLADEISDECLAAEADFALWIPDESERPWAYLAKGFLKQYDRELSGRYLDKVCEEAPTGPACAIAQHQANPKKYDIPEGTQTSRILKVTLDFEKGLYQDAEKQFVELSQILGLSDFSQSGLVKALWAQNRTERAQGAYQNVVHQLPRRQGIELSAWICHEQLDQSCSQEALEACENLKASLKGADQIRESFVALALIREKECRQSNSFEDFQFKALLQEKKDVLRYVLATSRNSDWSAGSRSLALQDLAFRNETVRPAFVRRLALLDWVKNHMKTEAEFSKIVSFLKDKKVHDLNWIKIYSGSLKAFIKANAQKSISEIVDLPSQSIIANHQLETIQIQAHYMAKNFLKAQAGLRQLDLSTGRSPASMGLGAPSLEHIKKELSNNLGESR